MDISDFYGTEEEELAQYTSRLSMARANEDEYQKSLKTMEEILEGLHVVMLDKLRKHTSVKTLPQALIINMAEIQCGPVTLFDVLEEDYDYELINSYYKEKRIAMSSWEVSDIVTLIEEGDHPIANDRARGAGLVQKARKHLEKRLQSFPYFFWQSRRDLLDRMSALGIPAAIRAQAKVQENDALWDAPPEIEYDRQVVVFGDDVKILHYEKTPIKHDTMSVWDTVRIAMQIREFENDILTLIVHYCRAVVQWQDTTHQIEHVAHRTYTKLNRDLEESIPEVNWHQEVPEVQFGHANIRFLQLVNLGFQEIGGSQMSRALNMYIVVKDVSKTQQIRITVGVPSAWYKPYYSPQSVFLQKIVGYGSVSLLDHLVPSINKDHYTVYRLDGVSLDPGEIHRLFWVNVYSADGPIGSRPFLLTDEHVVDFAHESTDVCCISPSGRTAYGRPWEFHSLIRSIRGDQYATPVLSKGEQNMMSAWYQRAIENRRLGIPRPPAPQGFVDVHGKLQKTDMAIKSTAHVRQRQRDKVKKERKGKKVGGTLAYHISQVGYSDWDFSPSIGFLGHQVGGRQIVRQNNQERRGRKRKASRGPVNYND